jgi:ElaB/YqjD/DUF883 family membrane-anchored ribosome-binding protein
MDAARLEQQYNRELEEMTDEIQAGIRSGKYTWGELQKTITDKSKQAVTATDQFVRESPWTALGVAAVAGCLVGYLISRR